MATISAYLRRLFMVHDAVLNASLARIRWEHPEVLVFGSLLQLSPDNIELLRSTMPQRRARRRIPYNNVQTEVNETAHSFCTNFDSRYPFDMIYRKLKQDLQVARSLRTHGCTKYHSTGGLKVGILVFHQLRLLACYFSRLHFTHLSGLSVCFCSFDYPYLDSKRISYGLGRMGLGTSPERLQTSCTWT